MSQHGSARLTREIHGRPSNYCILECYYGTIKWQRLNCSSRFGSGLNELAANHCSLCRFEAPALVIEGLVDQYKVFPQIKQVAEFRTCTVQFCNFVTKSCLLHVQESTIYVHVETSIKPYTAFQTLNSQLTSTHKPKKFDLVHQTVPWRGEHTRSGQRLKDSNSYHISTPSLHLLEEKYSRLQRLSCYTTFCIKSLSHSFLCMYS